MAAVKVYADTAKDQPARTRAGVVAVPFSYTLTSAFGATSTTSGGTADAGDTIVLCRLAPYTTLLSFVIDIPDLDSGATAARMDVGTRTDIDRFVPALDITAAAGKRVSGGDITVTSGTNVLISALPFRNLDTDAGDVTAEDDLRLTLVTAVLTTPILATIKGYALISCNEVQAMAEVKA